MAVDVFLKIDEVPGESQDSQHKGEIDVLAWSWGVSNSGTFHLGGGAGAGKANFQDLTITKYVDKASPSFMNSCASGAHYSKATMVGRKSAGTEKLEYFTIVMDKIFVSSYHTGGSGGGDDRITETVTLNFAEVEVKYIEQTEKGGKGAQPKFKWKIAENVVG